jgi:hypothetical protein
VFTALPAAGNMLLAGQLETALVRLALEM